jgi:SAM-dependent methyltransferase
MAGPTVDFWQQRFENELTGWDRGAASPQLLAWLESGTLNPCRIAVPGCGSGWEVAELAKRGFEVIGIDYTPAAVKRTRELLTAQGLIAEVLQADVLTYEPAKAFDAIYEQTCLCALHPDQWFNYAMQLQAWLKPEGSIFALFMQKLRPESISEGVIAGPPYHCDINAMRSLFPAQRWAWPKPPFAKVPHPNIGHELGLQLKLL